MEDGNYKEDIEHIMTEMFNRVNETYTPEYVKQENWFMEKEWSQEEQEDYMNWLEKEMLKEWKLLKCLMSIQNKSKKNIKRFANEFVLNYGWRQKL